jgi:subtilase family serine protease
MLRIALSLLSLSLLAACGAPSEEELASAEQELIIPRPLLHMVPDVTIRFSQTAPGRLEVSNLGTKAALLVNVLIAEPQGSYYDHISLEPGETQPFQVRAPPCGQPVTITLDPHNVLFELNETNNSIVWVHNCRQRP